MTDHDVRTVAIGDCVLGGPTRIIVPLMGATLSALEAGVEALAGHPVDLVEWRVDPMLAAGADAEAVLDCAHRLVDACPWPVIATIRTCAEGGMAAVSDADYALLVEALAGVCPAVDVEIEREGAADLVAVAQREGIVVIASNHDFAGTPGDEALAGIFQTMDRAGADVLKVACRADSADDAVRVLGAQAWARRVFNRPIIAIAMGSAGAVTRFAGSRLGSAATFAIVGRASAPGQFTAEQTRMVLDLVERG